MSSFTNKKWEKLLISNVAMPQMKPGIRSQKMGEKRQNIEQRTNEHPTLNAQHRTSNEKITERGR
jgi:hypothetical protein